MKNSLFLVFTFALTSVFAQSAYEKEILAARDAHVQEMIDPSKGILNQEELANYIRHDYFPINLNYKIVGKLKKVPAETLIIPTSSGKEKRYSVIGKVAFKLKGQSKSELYVLQDIVLSQKEEYKDYYFIPFRDATTGKQTYGAGRYMDVKIVGKKVTLDFNTAYNPYCAFSYRYNCPIPPERNHLKISIEAGEKTPLLHE